MKKLWRKFSELSSECYANMIQSNPSMDIWNEAFSLLLEIVDGGRVKKSSYAQELYQLDESTDYNYDVEGWLEDYLDELDMRKMYDELLQACQKLLTLFRWEEDAPSDLRFRIAFALGAQGRNEEALVFCEEWIKKEGDNVSAMVALIYARITMKDFEGAEQIVLRHISEDTVCTEENDIIFTAAALLYKVSGNKKAEKQVNKKLKIYEKEIERYFCGLDEEDIDFEISDEELPFN